MIRLTPPTYLILFFTSACCIAYGHELSADETGAVAARVRAYVTAFNQRDLDACAEHWSETAEYVLPASGSRVRGRKAIREALAERLEREKEEAVGAQDFERAAQLRDQAQQVRRKKDHHRAEAVLLGCWYAEKNRRAADAPHRTERFGRFVWFPSLDVYPLTVV